VVGATAAKLNNVATVAASPRSTTNETGTVIK